MIKTRYRKDPHDEGPPRECEGFHKCRAGIGPEVTAFYSSLVLLIVLMGGAVAYGKRRPLGTPLTWGEAMVAAMFVFGLFFLAYGIVPHEWLNWADSSLKWRRDATGIPLGAFRMVANKKWENHWYSYKSNALWPNGITFFGRGRVILTKETIRDAVAAGLYIVLLGVQIAMWSAWQKRGKKAAAQAAIQPSSAYGRPLVRKAQA